MIRRCDEIADLLFTNWDKYYSGNVRWICEYDALLTIDKKLRPHGSRSSAPGVFSFHKVSLVPYYLFSSFCASVVTLHEISAEMNTTLLHNKD